MRADRGSRRYVTRSRFERSHRHKLEARIFVRRVGRARAAVHCRYGFSRATTRRNVLTALTRARVRVASTRAHGRHALGRHVHVDAGARTRRGRPRRVSPPGASRDRPRARNCASPLHARLDRPARATAPRRFASRGTARAASARVRARGGVGDRGGIGGRGRRRSRRQVREPRRRRRRDVRAIGRDRAGAGRIVRDPAERPNVRRRPPGESVHRQPPWRDVRTCPAR